MKDAQFKHIRFSIYGAHHAIDHESFDAIKKAQELGAYIAQHGGIVNIPGVPGFPYWVGKGAFNAGGIVIGFSPAAGEKEHVNVYDLSVDYVHSIIYSGFGYAGADLLQARSSDANVFGYGGVASLHEFWIAFQEGKPIGVLQGDWDHEEVLYHLLKDNEEFDHSRVIFDKDPQALVVKLASMAREHKTKMHHLEK